MTTVAEALERAPRIAAAPRADVTRWGRNIAAGTLAALPGLLTVYLSFNAGGYFAGAQGAVVAVLAICVAVRIATVRDPFGGFSRPLGVAIAGLALYALWALASSHWSHSPARALLEFDLANIYLFALILFGSSARSNRRVRWTVLLTWLALLAVCLVSLAVRLRPDLFPIPVNLSPNRLAFPLTYWNALGLFGAVGITLALYLASSTREPRPIRVLATSAIPIFGVMILLTYSRSAIVLGAGGLLVYALLARPRGLIAALIAAVPTSVFAIAATYQAKLISNADTSAAAVQQGRHLTVTIAIACGASALARIALLELDSRLASLNMTAVRRHNARIVLGLLCGVALLVSVLGFGHQIAQQWQNFTKQDSALGTNDVRSRISNFRIGGRIGGWKIALRGFDANPLHGAGANTFAIDWNRYRTKGGTALEAHSIYVEAIGELGLVGLGALVVPLVVLIGGCFVRRRRSARSLWTALGVVGLLWAAHAGVDWDWEMPAVTLPVFALVGCALGRRGGGLRFKPRAELALRAIVCLVALAVAVTGIRISVSDHHLNASVVEFNSGNCPGAVADANASLSAVPSRPQPRAIIGYCDVLSGRATAAVQSMQGAVARDPQSWYYLYGLAVAKADAGQNPLPALRSAATLNPLESFIQTARTTLTRAGPKGWRRAAPSLPMLVSMRQ